jgi:hypothetical protein
MTVPSTPRAAGPFNGNGVTTSFPFEFKVFSDEDVQVVHTGADGAQTILVLDSDYSVSVNADQGANPGGSVTYPLSGDPLPSGESLAVVGNLAYEQATGLASLGNFSLAVIEAAFDKGVILVQQLRERLLRTIAVPVGESADLTLPAAADRANKTLAFDDDGNVIATATAADVQAAVDLTLGYRDDAEAWARKTDGPVSGSDFSAKYHALSVASALESATEQKDIATAAALRAQQAINTVAISSNGPFENTTDGLANTSSSGATDRYFTVAVENSDTALILYYNDGGVAREITRYASLGETVDTAATLLGDEPDGIAIDATTERTDEAVLVRDTATPSNDYDGSLAGFFASTVFPAHRLLVQEDGSLKWQDHQLFAQSKDFTTASWAKTTTTVTALSAEDDGEIPYEMAATSTTSRIQQNPTVISGAWYSVEFIVKADTSARCYVTVNTDGTNPRAYFHLSGAGTVSSATAGLTTAISTDDVDGTPLPSGRYRIVVRFKTAGTTLNAALGQCDADASTNVTSGRKLKVYRAQMYRGVKSLAFLLSTSTVPVRGIPYDWTHGYRALLVEEMNTNYRSMKGDELTDAAVWTATDITAAYDATGPHGEPCSTITATADNGTILQTTATASTNHTMTAWVRRKTGTGKLYARLNGTDSEITGLSTTAWKKVKFTRTIASAVATFGLKIETSGDEFEVALLKCADQAFATSDLTTHGVVPTQRLTDVPRIALTRFPSGAAMTAYFDFVTAQDLPATSSVGMGFVTTGGDYAAIANSNDYLRAQHSVSGTLTNFVLGDFTRGARVEGTLRVDTNNHGGSVNGFGAGYDVRPGAPNLTDTTFGSQAGPLWLRRLMVIPRALEDGELERWKYSGDGRDARYLDDVIVARHAEAADVLTQREPGLSKFYDRADEAGGFVTWVERNINTNPSHVELPCRIRGRSWTVDKTTGRITEGPDVTLVEPTDWATGKGHTQSPTIIKRTKGADKGRTWFLWTQLDTADGLISPDHRRIYAAYSDDNLATLSTPVVVYDRGPGTAVLLAPSGDAVELPADSAHPGRLVVSFYASDAPNMGVLYCDAGSTTWTEGATATVSGANEPALALRPDGTMLMTIRTETPNQHYEAVISDGGETFGTAALIASGSFTNTALSLSQMDPDGEEGRYGKMLLVGARASSPFARSGFSVEELVGQPVVPSGSQFRPIGSTRMAGYAASLALSGGFLLAGYEDSAGNSFNDRCSIRLMLLRP